MGWTSPKSWVTGYKVLASDLQTYLSDNDSALRAGGIAIASQAAGDIVYASSGTALVRLGADAGKFLQSGASSPSWATISFATLSPLTTRGDLLYSSSGTVTGERLALGGGNTFLKSDGNDITWGVATTMDVLTTSTNYSVTTGYSGRYVIVLVDASGGSRTVTLYAASGRSGNQVSVKKTDSSANTVTIDGNASETIDASTTQVISAQFTSLSMVCDGSNWHIF